MAKNENWHPRDYQSFQEVSADLDRIQVAHEAGTLRTTGNWTAGQICEHCANFMKAAFDGFVDEQGKQVKFPFYLRFLGVALLKPMIGRSHMKPGIKLPAEAKSMLPEDDREFDRGIELLRAQIARVDAGERMQQASPLFGKLPHDKWVKLHLDHCRLHMGFIQTNAG